MPMKLLDYGKLNPFGEVIGQPKRLAWPVNAYRVTMPKALDDSNSLNPFERVILQLLTVDGAANACALADETRIPLDLVKVILLRLRDRGFIDDHNAIVKKERDDNGSNKAKSPVFVTSLLFREIVTGKILPFLHTLDDSTPLRKKEGDKGYFRLKPSAEAQDQNPPTARDVIQALRAMKKRSSAFGKNEISTTVQLITIARSPESYHLECPIAIQKCDGEYRIADPFGNGFSLVLEIAFTQLLEKDEKVTSWVRDWQQSLSNTRIPKLGDSKERLNEPFDNNTNWQLFPKLIASLRPSRKTSFRSLSEIYASLEWALFYACSRRSFKRAVMQLRFAKQLEHPDLLASAARHVGLLPPKHGFRAIPEGKLLDFENGQAALGTVLAITVLQAEMDESHPLRRIASTHPDLVTKLLEIKKRRDEKGHGKGSIDAPEYELLEDRLMREIVHALLPAISFADTPTAGPDKEERADSLLDARASIQGEFGFGVFNRLGPNLQERLIHAERFWLSCNDGDDALVFACDLYAAVQSVFDMELAGKFPPDLDDSDFVNAAGKKGAEARLCEFLPECLCTVKVLAIRQTLQGTGQTLGSCVIAFLLMSDDDILRAIADSQPTFIDDITTVIARRGHGNEPLPLPKAEIAKLRKATYSTIKTLIET